MKELWVLLFATLTLNAMEPLVSAQWLQDHLNDKHTVILDVSDASLYQTEHIKGSLNAPIQAWRKAQNGHLVVKDAKDIQKLMRTLGINQNTRVVVYSHHENAKDILKATYVLWAMEYYGLKESALLDGGLIAWKSLGGKTTHHSDVAVKKGDFRVNTHPELLATLMQVKAKIGTATMVDARPAKFYFGAQKQSVLARAGHIPKAKSYFWQYSFEGNRLKKREVLHEMLVSGLGLDPKSETITYCTGGLETSMNFFVLHRLLGFEKIRLYDASMKEWANREDTPMQVYRWE